MPLFSYSGLDAGGAPQSGRIEARDGREARGLLREQGVFVLELYEGLDETLGNEGIGRRGRRFLALLHPRPVLPGGAGDLVIFVRQGALVLRAGFTLVNALDAIGEMEIKGRLRRAIRRMSDEIRRGAGFSTALAREKAIFSRMVVSLAASGEQSGNLDAILDRLSDNMARTRELKRQLISAMFYPLFVLIAAIAVVVFLMVGVIPRFAVFLAARHASLPASTQLLMDISAWAVDYGKIIAIVAGSLVFAVLALYTNRRGKLLIDRAILAIPLVGTAVLYSAMALSGWSMGMLLTSGVTALESLRITSTLIGNLALSKCLQRAAERLLAGRSLSRALDQTHIPLMMRHMAMVGESSGQLDTVMQDVGEYYQKELTAKVKIIAVMIEPTLIIVVGGLVGFVYFAFFQAVISVSKGGM